MENGVTAEDNRSVKMGATSNPNTTSRLAALQERKKTIEETLAERNKELKQLCIQEAELTGIMPLEIPLEPGESPPTFRRRVGTAYQLSQNLINNLNNKEESITALELQKQIQANMAEAALGLANEPHISKTLRRRHRMQYQYHKQQYSVLEDKLMFLKSQTQTTTQQPSPQQQKQKKKPRPVDQEDTVSIGNDTFGKTVLRHSMRSLQHPSMSDTNSEQRYSVDHQRLAYRSSADNPIMDTGPIFLRNDDILTNGVYRLSINGYKNYMERRESSSTINSSHISPQYVHSQSNPNIYQQQHQQPSSLTNPHPSRRSPQQLAYNYVSPTTSHYSQDYSMYGNINTHVSPRHSSVPHHKLQYYPSHTIHGQPSYKQYVEQMVRHQNVHQIQPHQQYEHDVMNAGLGGCWKRTESGEMVWCNSVSVFEDASWQRDKRFGSLDRRRNKLMRKRTSPLVESKPVVVNTPVAEPVSPSSPGKSSQVVPRNRQDNRQLVRTQSLGSVGAQTVDNVWPSDENSSCESDAHSIELAANARKQKQKEWYETALDGPSTPTLPRHSHSTVTEEMVPPAYSYVPQLPPVPKVPLEIPAESNPSPRIPETNMELFNNNIPKNCTVVQAGVCKPYHEETKPFEMSDFYKYSTKFKKSPQKQESSETVAHNRMSTLSNHSQRSLIETFDNDNNPVVQKGVCQPLESIKCHQSFNANNSSFTSAETSANVSLDLSQLSSNVAEKFSAEMNDWYQSHEQQSEARSPARSPSKNRSTATLV